MSCNGNSAPDFFFLNCSLPDILHYTVISWERSPSKLGLLKMSQLISFLEGSFSHSNWSSSNKYKMMKSKLVNVGCDKQSQSKPLQWALTSLKTLENIFLMLSSHCLMNTGFRYPFMMGYTCTAVMFKVSLKENSQKRQTLNWVPSTFHYRSKASSVTNICGCGIL